MRTLFLLCFCAFGASLFSQSSLAQARKELPKEEWQVGYSPFARAANILKFEVHKKVVQGHYIGLHGGPLVGNAQIDRWDNIQKPVRGTFLKAVHKAYLLHPEEMVAFYASHGFFVQDSRTTYPGTVWETFVEDGVEYLRAVEGEKDFSTLRMGYDVSLGMEFRVDFFYLDLSLGLGFVNKLSSTEAPSSYDFDHFIYGINYEGMRLLPAIKLGYLIN